MIKWLHFFQEVAFKQFIFPYIINGFKTVELKQTQGIIGIYTYWE